MAAVGDVCAGLLRHKHILLRELCDTNILDVLVKKGILNLNEFEIITGANDSDKCNYFIEIVSKQSGVKLNDLCVILSKECPKLSKELMNDRHRFIVNAPTNLHDKEIEDNIPCATVTHMIIDGNSIEISKYHKPQIPISIKGMVHRYQLDHETKSVSE
ncbi:hypothetical protein SFRURICE_008407 [Spodoptera frugiperda]|uniref:SFRICE_005235 n=1 Tax=Spodoptera frugiperda TaxID=7108 RepID=A0A2H1VAG4_SPOFR|nr:hypothetical protein SFRURICE_008407 [Spodoptera frugiperda]